MKGFLVWYGWCFKTLSPGVISSGTAKQYFTVFKTWSSQHIKIVHTVRFNHYAERAGSLFVKVNWIDTRIHSNWCDQPINGFLDLRTDMNYSIQFSQLQRKLTTCILLAMQNWIFWFNMSTIFILIIIILFYFSHANNGTVVRTITNWESVFIRCYYSQAERPVWTFNNAVVNLNTVVINREFKEKAVIFPNYTLYITSVSFDEEGSYQCRHRSQIFRSLYLKIQGSCLLFIGMNYLGLIYLFRRFPLTDKTFVLSVNYIYEIR